MGRAPRCDLAALVPLAAAAAMTVSLVVGCTDERDARRKLADGSAAPAPPIELEDVDEPLILSRARRYDVRSVEPGSAVASCLADGWSDAPAGAAVHRVGAHGESVTFRTRSGRSLQACDGTGRTPGERSRWCGHAFGRLSGGRLRDPRLDLGGCKTGQGKPVAFVWVTPSPHTRWVVVEHDGLSEAYEALGSAPVRVATTSGVDVERSRAVVTLSEHAGDGRRLRTYELEAGVAG